ncbi:MAG: hypothetical protein JWO12_2330 [Frankiales bacterium]|nr:hypothetical protein [Frankiales bacterium]
MHRLATVSVLSTVVTAALLTSGLTVPALADAAPTSPVAFTVVDTDGNGSYGLYRDVTPGGTATAIVPESADHAVYEVSASQDGSRIVTVEDATSADGVTSQVVVRDVSGRIVRVVSSTFQSYAGPTDPNPAVDFTVDEAARLSPDGTQVVWTTVMVSGDSSTPVLKTAPVAAGAPTTIPGTTGLVLSSYLDATTLVATSADQGGVVTFPITGITAQSPSHPLGNAPADSADFVVSPDGSKVAFRVDRDPAGTQDASRIDLEVAPLTLVNGVATLGEPTVLTDALENSTPVWISATALDFIRSDGAGGFGDVWTVPADGSTPAVATRETDADEISIAVGQVDSVAPPAPTADVPFALAGSSATIAWTAPPATPDLSGYLVTRTFRGATTVLPFVPAPRTQTTDTGLYLGTDYTYEITAVDRSGNVSPAVTRTMTALGTRIVVPVPTSATSTTATFPVTFGAGDPAGTVFTVDVSTNGGPFTRWVDHAAGVTRSYPGAIGSTYAFRVQAFDAYGNSTAVATSQQTTVPYDQTKARYSRGYGTARYSDAWYHSVTILKTTGGYGVVTLPGHRFQLLVTRCSTCGVVEVVYGGRVLASVDTYARVRTPRQAVASITWTSNANRTLTIRTKSTKNRPNVYVDGFTMWR